MDRSTESQTNAVRYQSDLILVAAIAAAARLWHLRQIARAPFYTLLLGDAAAYDSWARDIAGGHWTGDAMFYQAPLYPYFLACVYTALGRSVAAVRYLQAGFGVASSVLVADAARRLVTRRAGLAAGVILALYPPAIFLESLIQKTAIDELSLCLILWVLARDPNAVRRSTAWWTGILSGALILTRENAAVLVVPLGAWLFTRGAPAARRLVVFAAGVALVVAPVAARNRIVGGAWVLTTAQFGPNFYIGNNPEADGTYRPLVPWRGNATFEKADATSLAEHALGRPLAPTEVSRYFRDRALQFIVGKPRVWLGLLARKLVLVFNSIEIPDTEDQYTYARWSWVLRAGAAFNFGVLVAAAALGVWITRSRWRTLWFLHAIVAMYAASLVAFYVMARYRFLLVPPLVVFAGAAVAESIRYFQQRPRSERIIAAAACVLLLIASERPIVAQDRLEALMRFNTAVGLQVDRRLDEAVAEYRAAITLDPTMAIGHYNLGLALQQTGRIDEAVFELRAAVALAPSDPRALNNLGVALGRTGQSSEAGEYFQRALRIDPNLVEARTNLAEWYERRGRLTDAAAELEAAVRTDPRSLAAWKVLARVRARERRFDLALEAAQQSATLAPDDVAVLNTLGIALAQAGRAAEAIATLERALTLEPGNQAIRRNLDQIKGGSRD